MTAPLRSRGDHALDALRPALLAMLPITLLPAQISSAAPASRAGDIVPGQALVELRATAGQTDGTRIDAAHLVQVCAKIRAATGVELELLRPMHFGWARFSLRRDHAPELDAAGTWRALDALRRSPEVAAADPVRILHTSALPSDTGAYLQWGLESVNAPAAWDLTTGLDTQRVGVVDTGLYRLHEDLLAKDAEGYDFISSSDMAGDGDGRDADYSDPMDRVACDGEPLDLIAHGTHVAGTLAASTDNSLGIAGVNWAAQLVTVRNMNVCGDGTSDDLLDGLVWLAGFSVEGVPDISQPVRVINLSLGGAYPCEASLQTYIDALVLQRGVVMVAASGNEGNTQAVHAPANCQHVISVGAHGPGSDRPLTRYTNFEGKVDIVAPGGDLRASAEGGMFGPCGDDPACYQFAQGTSMATPMVSGAVSLMLALQPDLSFDQIVTILQQTGVACEGCGDVPALQLDAALAMAEETTPEEPEPYGESCLGDPCWPGGRCGEGFTCVVNDAGDSCCHATCDPDAGLGACDEGLRCAKLSSGGGVCMPGGTRVEGESCKDSPSLCRADHACATYEGEKTCLRQCDDAHICRSASSACQPISGSSVGICVPPLEPDQAKTQETCDPRRGHWDCAEGFGCREPEGDDGAAVCVLGAQGNTYSGYTCEAAVDCESGLCVKGLCTVPCAADGSCTEPFSCDDDAIPGGLCMPKECGDEPGACPDGWECTTTPSEDQVCAAAGCGCTTRAEHGVLALLLVALCGLWRRQRRALARG